MLVPSPSLYPSGAILPAGPDDVAPISSVPDRPVPESRRPLLVVRLHGAGRDWSVLGSDDARGVVAEGFTASADQSGPTSAGFNLRRDPTHPHADLASFSEMDAEIGGIPVWSGRVWETPGNSGDERSLSVSARGWQSHLDDDVYKRLYAHQRMSDFRDLRTASATVNLDSWISSGQVTAQQGQIVLSFPAGTAIPFNGNVGVVFDAGLDDIRRVVVEYETSANSATELLFIARGSANMDGTVSTTDAFGDDLFTLGASGTASGTLSGNRRYLLLFMTATVGFTAGVDHWVRIKAVRLFRSTGYESGGNSTLKASTVVADARAAAAPLLSSSSERITTTTFSIPHMETGGYQSPRSVMEAANAYHNYMLGVDARRRVFFEPRPDYPELEVGEWSGASFSDQSIGSAENVYNRVIVQGQTGSGGTLEVTRTADAPLLDRLGITRTMVLQVNAVLTQASAEVIGDVWLAEHARAQFKGSLSVVGMGGVREVKTGRPVHPSELLLQTGKKLRFAHLVDPDTGGQGRDGTIDSVSYSHDDETAQVSIDNTRGALVPFLARVGALQEVAIS